MNRTKTNPAEAEQTALDHILATEDPLVPSSGFLASVMERVHEEAAAPPPIPFPWKRAIPGLVFVSGVFSWSAFEVVRRGLPAVSTVTLAVPHINAAAERPLEEAGWVAFALGASLLSWLLSRRLAGRSGLL
jgi:hypothetical protein